MRPNIINFAGQPLSSSSLNVRHLQFALGSASLHLGLAALLWYGGQFEHGVAQTGKSPLLPAMSEYALLHVTLDRPNTDRHRDVTSLKPVRGALERRTFIAAKTPSPAQAKPSPLPVMAAQDIAAPPSEPASKTIFEYFPEGRLTKVPTPLTEIDLNVPNISGLAYIGKADLTILIDSNGMVMDVLIASETDSVNAFADLAATRFREARFTPGEIDGVPVKSALHITVVSEGIPSAPVN